MFYFAYDGSINGDWVSHYAARLAANGPEKRLQLVYVREGKKLVEKLEEKIERMKCECQQLGVELQPHIQTVAGSVLQTVLSSVKAGPDHYLVCGTRVRERERGLLTGTISEQLLQHGHCNVLAVRVFQPGMLGCPRSLLLPVSGHPRGFRSGLPFLKLFVPDLVHMHILFVRQISRWRFRMLSHPEADRLRKPGEIYCQRVEREIGEQLGITASVLDANTVVSDDVPKEIVIAANRTKSRMIYMGASESNLTKRFLYGNPIEQVLRDATCDVAIYRGVQ